MLYWLNWAINKHIKPYQAINKDIKPYRAINKHIIKPYRPINKHIIKPYRAINEESSKNNDPKKNRTCSFYNLEHLRNKMYI